MSEAQSPREHPIYLKYLTPDAVRAQLERDSRLIVPVGTTEQHGPHLPLGRDTFIVEQLADDLSTEFGVLRAPTVEYGVNAPTMNHYPGSASVHRKTLHRFLNDLVGSWEAGGVQQFIIITAHGSDPHLEAVSTLHTRRARVRTVDIFAVPIEQSDGGGGGPIHGGELDTSLLLYVDATLVDLKQARDYFPPKAVARRYQRGGRGAIPKDSPGSIGRPSLASVEKGEQLYHFIYERIASRVFRNQGVPEGSE